MKFLLALLLVFQTVLPAWGATGKVIQADKVSGTDAGKNYLAQGDAEVLITGINQYNDGSVTRPVDCTGGTGGVTMARSSTSPIEDKFSWIVTKDATNRQGQGISIDFTAPKAKAMTIAAKYLVNSGTFAAGSNGTSPTDSDLIFYVYDVTNSRLIEPSTFRLYSNQTSTDEPYLGEFQTNSDSTSYRLCLHVATTSASAWSLKLDDIEVKRSKYAAGTPITDWADTPSPTISGFGTVTGVQYRSRRVGDSLEVQAYFTAGTVAASAASISASYAGAPVTIDTSKIGIGQAVGYGATSTSPTTTYFSNITAIIKDTSSVGIGVQSSTQSSLTMANGNAVMGTGSSMSISFKVPITGWSSSVQVSDGYDGQVIAGSLQKTSNQTITSGGFQKVTFQSSSVNDGGITDTTNSRMNIKSAGDYEFNAQLILNASSSGTREIALYKNGSLIESLGNSPTNSAAEDTRINGKSTPIKAVAGDYFEIYVFQNSGGNIDINGAAGGGYNYFGARKLPGSATISATETVSALYTGAPPTGTLNGSFNLATFGTKVKDSHGAYSGGTYTIPVSGQYDIAAQIGVSATFSGTAYGIVAIYIDGVIAYSGVQSENTTVAIQLHPTVSVKAIPLRAGQLITIRSYCDAGSPTFIGASDRNWFSITRSGGY